MGQYKTHPQLDMLFDNGTSATVHKIYSTYQNILNWYNVTLEIGKVILTSTTVHQYNEKLSPFA